MTRNDEDTIRSELVHIDEVIETLEAEIIQMCTTLPSKRSRKRAKFDRVLTEKLQDVAPWHTLAMILGRALDEEKEAESDA